LKILSQQFPSVFLQDKSKKYQGLSKFQAIAVMALLAEHSFWFDGGHIENQLPHAIKSFNSQSHINTVKAKVETAFNDIRNKEDPTWLIQWVIDNKLDHK